MVTSRLSLKMARDLRAARWQFVAIALVAALGVAMVWFCIPLTVITLVVAVYRAAKTTGKQA